MFSNKKKIIENALQAARNHYGDDAKLELQYVWFNGDLAWWEVCLVHDTLTSEWRLWNFDKQ